MNFIQAEQALIAQELRKELGKRFNVNQFPTTYPEPNGELVSVGDSRSIFESRDGRKYTCDNWIASNVIWGR